MVVRIFWVVRRKAHLCCRGPDQYRQAVCRSDGEVCCWSPDSISIDVPSSAVPTVWRECCGLTGPTLQSGSRMRMMPSCCPFHWGSFDDLEIGMGGVCDNCQCRIAALHSAHISGGVRTKAHCQATRTRSCDLVTEFGHWLFTSGSVAAIPLFLDNLIGECA